MNTKEYKKWILGLSTSDLKHEYEAMHWVASFGSSNEVKRTASEKMNIVALEMQIRKTFDTWSTNDTPTKP